MEVTDFIDVNNLPKDLIRNILKKKVVPFIGAGFSIPFGYPNWRELIIGIKEKLGITELKDDDINNVDPLQIAQALFHYYSKISYEDCKQEILRDLAINATQMENSDSLKKLVDEQIKVKLEIDFSKILLELIIQNEDKTDASQIEKLKRLDEMEFSAVVTTNYDRVLEEEIFTKQQFKVQSLGKNEELDWNEKEKTIIKIHGDKESNNGVIFTLSQYYKFMDEYGYFRSKLYTIFSSNVVLMMGYGFSDINIHQIYFQFLRDYGKNINGSKFYMVLTEYDLIKWGSYFEFYKYYLDSYKIEVLLVKDLPTFVENLSEAVTNELNSTNLESLFESTVTNDFKNIMMAVVNGEEYDVIYDSDLNNDILNAFIKIFNNEYLLTRDPFNLEESDLNAVGLYMLKYAVEIFEENSELISTIEFKKILYISIAFANKTGDFYGVRNRLEYFLDLNSYITNLDLDEEFGENLYEVFGFCHPTKYLKSNPGGRLLEERIRDLSIQVVKNYLEYILLNNLDEEEGTIYLDSVHKYWIKLIKMKFEDTYIQELIENIMSMYEE